MWPGYRGVGAGRLKALPFLFVGLSLGQGGALSLAPSLGSCCRILFPWAAPVRDWWSLLTLPGPVVCVSHMLRTFYGFRGFNVSRLYRSCTYTLHACCTSLHCAPPYSVIVLRLSFHLLVISHSCHFICIHVPATQSVSCSHGFAFLYGVCVLHLFMST